MAGLAPEAMPFDTTRLAGPMLVGVSLTYLLFGAYLVQLAHYVGNIAPAEDDDSVNGGSCGKADGNTLVIVILTLVEGASVAFITQATWYALVLGIKDRSLLLVPHLTAPAIPFLNGLAATIVQLFFARKIYILATKRVERWLAAVISLLSFLQFGVAIAIAALFIMNGRQYDESPNADIILMATIGFYLSATLVCDALITMGMMILLNRYRHLTEFSATKRLLDSLKVHTLENGLATTICAALGLIFFFGTTGDSIHVLFQYIIGRLYANVLLAAANRRYAIASRARRQPTLVIPTMSIPLSDLGSGIRFAVDSTVQSQPSTSKAREVLNASADELEDVKSRLGD